MIHVIRTMMKVGRKILQNFYRFQELQQTTKHWNMWVYLKSGAQIERFIIPRLI